MPSRSIPAGRIPSPACSDRKSTRLNSSHLVISYAVFCLKKKNSAQRVARYAQFQGEQYGRDVDLLVSAAEGCTGFADSLHMVLVERYRAGGAGCYDERV